MVVIFSRLWIEEIFDYLPYLKIFSWKLCTILRHLGLTRYMKKRYKESISFFIVKIETPYFCALRETNLSFISTFRSPSAGLMMVVWPVFMGWGSWSVFMWWRPWMRSFPFRRTFPGLFFRWFLWFIFCWVCWYFPFFWFPLRWRWWWPGFWTFPGWTRIRWPWLWPLIFIHLTNLSIINILLLSSNYFTVNNYYQQYHFILF